MRNSAPRIWVVVDQAATSLRPLLVGLLAVRMLSLEAFGAFTIAFVSYNIVRGSLGAGLGNVLLTREESRDSHAGSALAIQLLAAVCAMAVFGTCAALFDGPLRLAFLALAFSTVPLLLFDFLRTLAHARHHSGRAAAASVVWLMAVVALLSILAIEDLANTFAVTLAWGATSLPAIVILLVGRSEALRSPALWWRKFSSLTPRFAVDFLLMSGAGQAGSYVLGATTGIADSGALRLAQLPMSPVGVWIQVSRLVVLPRLGSAASEGSARQVVRSSVRGVVLPSVVYVAVAYVALAQVGDQLFGDSWMEAQTALLPVCVATVARSASAVSLMVVQATSEGKELLRVRFIDAALTLVLIVSGAVMGGLTGAAWGHAGANVVATLLWANLAGECVSRSEARSRLHQQRQPLDDSTRLPEEKP